MAFDSIPLGTNPQSFEARIVWLQQVTAAQPEYFWWLSPFVLFCQDIFLHQRGLNWYLCGVILLSGILLFRSNNERHPSFVIFMLAMILAPNVMWYHHYTLMLLPLLIYMDGALTTLATSRVLVSSWAFHHADRSLATNSRIPDPSLRAPLHNHTPHPTGEAMYTPFQTGEGITSTGAHGHGPFSGIVR